MVSLPRLDNAQAAQYPEGLSNPVWGCVVAAAKKRELFEVFQPSDREPAKGDSTPAPSTSKPPTPPPPPSRPPEPPQKKTLWEERSSGRSDQVTFTLSRGALLFAAIVFVLLIAIAYALGQRSGRRITAASQEPVMRESVPLSSPAPRPTSVEVVPPAAASVESGYQIQLISYGKKTKSGMADQLIASLQKAGYRTWKVESEDHVGVRAGLFSTREDAEKAKQWFMTHEVGGIGPFRHPDPVIHQYSPN